MNNKIKSIALASVLLVAPVAAQARIVDCPQDGRPYSTVHGYYVDVPGTSQYVEPSRRNTSTRTTTNRGRFSRPTSPFGSSRRSYRF